VELAGDRLMSPTPGMARPWNLTILDIPFWFMPRQTRESARQIALIPTLVLTACRTQPPKRATSC